MNSPHVTVYPGQRADRHARLRASLEQKTLAILSAKPETVEPAVRSLSLFAETLSDLGVIDGDERRECAKRAVKYAEERIDELTLNDGEEALTAIGLFLLFVSLVLVACTPCYLILIKSFVPTQKNLDFLSELESPLRTSGWALLIALICIALGSGFRSAFAMAGRWKITIGLAFIFTCAILILGLAWPRIQYYV